MPNQVSRRIIFFAAVAAAGVFLFSFPALAHSTVAPSAPPALRVRTRALAPVLQPTDKKFDFATISAKSVLVVDANSRRVILSRNADVPHPAASLTKLMTAIVAIDRKTPMARQVALEKSDEVGGARLRVSAGTRLTVANLLRAALIGSANNAANALSRAPRLSKEQFLRAMNDKARKFGLSHTKFVDPSGIDPANVSTAEEIAALGFEALDRSLIKIMTTTSTAWIRTAKGSHKIKNTNDLLTDEHNGLFVMGGKTGYLDEAGWNLMVKMTDGKHRPLMIVVLGSKSKEQVFKDAETLARWTWSNYKWARQVVK